MSIDGEAQRFSMVEFTYVFLVHIVFGAKNRPLDPRPNNKGSLPDGSKQTILKLLLKQHTKTLMFKWFNIAWHNGTLSIKLLS